MGNHPPIPKGCPFFPSVAKLNKADGANRKGVWFWLPKGEYDMESFGFEISDDALDTCGRLDRKMVAIIAAHYWSGNREMVGAWEKWGGL